ncbi:Presequence translocated-associated motor subunit pam17, mitochondrial [Fulvia fulva]|uniref:Presequence translocated-associated motor subunit PAM17 n=1 Tax=Passalora fulva TaxID=5499 RepID=A0A9Q8LFG9_PASFU|nr:Presequence translocated-associated motor subunit pam17, mitochondrial [Fulvia fulva]KAK4616198.1 Presequence translocated-associated motor subunit pam17, mitochondrial [Fulvia fulva]KAK4617153.1 Presequence translocated-associated motor subunit pam17, mitochondrial [Fulvia fulva]UJO15698.1 Presequence translocated-associated motor subunit pam17, mitochondrial [Fulvia fulva]WPV19686.1 Presequence translocated-associated motor subunit pam17, mitochondrial [Fulvia fulva]WPV34545.1 Presequence
MATLLWTRTSCLRAVNTPGKGLFAPALFTATFTTATQVSKQPRFTPNASPSQLPTHQLPSTRIGLRCASTSPATDSEASVPEHILTWNRFFDLRKKRRWINLGCSGITAFTAISLVTPILAAQDLDSWGAQISGLDPIIVLGISTAAVAAGGWLCGPSFGSAMFSMWAARRGWNKLIAEKEKSFYARIKRYRADPSASSPQNPIPDYYGEKISSVKDYRRWLKDQKAFNLKKDKAML